MKKWLIDSPGNSERNITEKEQDKWEKNYELNKYDAVWSITEDERICQKLSSGIKNNYHSILIAGCGSKTFLQQYIRKFYKGQITCTDWSKSALDYAKGDYSDEKLTYIKDDMTDMQFCESSFDHIIISNAILSGDDMANRKMLEECHRVLKCGGTLDGLFPSILAAYEISFLEKEFEYLRKNINFKNNTFYEKTQDMYQIFYTPLRLRRIFKESHFTIDRFEIFFCDTEHLLKENKRIYDLPIDSDLVIWEFFISAKKVNKI